MWKGYVTTAARTGCFSLWKGQTNSIQQDKEKNSSCFFNFLLISVFDPHSHYKAHFMNQNTRPNHNLGLTNMYNKVINNEYE